MYHFYYVLAYVCAYAHTSARKNRDNYLFFTDLRLSVMENGLRYYCTAFTIAIKKGRYHGSGRKSVCIVG